MRASTPRRRGPGAGRDQGGVVLILVLLVLALLLAVAGEFAQGARLEARTSLNFRGAVSAGYLAEAGYHRAAAEILPEAVAQELDETGTLVFRRGEPGRVETPERRDIALGPGRFSYRITDEEARLSLNTATPEQLHRLLLGLGVEREARDVIVDSILDWRDPNEEHRLNGAESDYYLALPVPYRAKNADFDSVAELLQVRGVTRQLLLGQPGSPGLAEHVTAVRTRGVNLNTASPAVLRALGLGEAQVEFILRGRPFARLDAVLPLLPPNVRAVHIRSTTFRIEATGEVPGQGRRRLLAVVQRRAGRDGVMRVLPVYWQWDPEAPGEDARG